MLLSSAKTLWFPLIGAGCRKNKTTSRGISWMLECTLRIYIYRGEPIKKIEQIQLIQDIRQNSWPWFDCKGEICMNYKKIFPYALSFAIMLPITNIGGSTEEKQNIKIEIKKPLLLPKIVKSYSHGNDVIYVYDNGAEYKRSGGTRAWRNFNPGNIRYSDLARENGAIGKAGGFAVFPDEKVGTKALRALLMSDAYKNLSIESAIFKYAPPHENNTEHYKWYIKKNVGIKSGTKISQLDKKQMDDLIKFITIIEGWENGTENIIAYAYTTKNVKTL